MIEKEKKMLKIRMGTFDPLKGLLIISVVVGHALSHYNISERSLLSVLSLPLYLVGLGAMPAFFLIAGMTFKPKSISTCLKQTSKSMLKYYAITGLCVILLFPVVYYIRTGWLPSVLEETSRWVLAYLLGVSTKDTYFFGYRVYECYVVWFMPTMFIGINLLNLVLKIKKTYIQVLAVISGGVLGYVMSRVGIPYFFIAQGLVAQMFCYCGYLVKKIDLFNRAKWTVWVYIFCITCYILQWKMGVVSFAYINFVNNFVEFVYALGSGMLLVLLALKVANSKWEAPEWLAKTGMNSLWILCIHSVELTVFPWEKLVQILPLPQNVIFIIEMLAKVAIIVPGCVVLNKITRAKYKKNKMKKSSISQKMKGK